MFKITRVQSGTELRTWAKAEDLAEATAELISEARKRGLGISAIIYTYPDKAEGEIEIILWGD